VASGLASAALLEAEEKGENMSSAAISLEFFQSKEKNRIAALEHTIAGLENQETKYTSDLKLLLEYHRDVLKLCQTYLEKINNEKDAQAENS
jgi:hypothetical protein